MKTKTLFVLTLTILMLMVISCSSEEDENSSEISNAYWGDWMVLDSPAGERYYYNGYYEGPNFQAGDIMSISRNEVKNTGGNIVASSNFDSWNVNIKELNNIMPRMVEISLIERLRRPSIDLQGGYYYDTRKYKIIPHSLRKNSFTGRVVSLASDSRSISNRAVSGIGGIQGIVDNLTDKTKPKQPVKTDSNGNFTVEDSTIGDTYGITFGDQTIEFTPKGNGDDLGNITKTSGTNFKASIIISNNTYLSIKNIGTTRAQGTGYTMTSEKGLNIHNNQLSGILGTFDPGEEKTIQLSISFDPISSDFIWKKIFVEIFDPINNKRWNDSVSVLFQQTKPTFFICYIEDLNLGINITVISPNGIAYGKSRSNTGIYDTVHVIEGIEKINGEYILIVTAKEGNSIEGMYAIYNSSKPNFPSPITIEDVSRYKPNHTLGQAVKTTLPIIAYSIRGNIDFYKVTF